MNKFLQFILGQEVRKFLIMDVIGLIIVLIGSLVLNTGRASFIVNVIGAILMLTSTQEIMNRVPKG